MTEIIIPVKNLESAKLRLSECLAPAKRAELVISMLQDLLITLSKVDYARVWVVSSDDMVCAVSEVYGASPIREQQAYGYNSAVALGLAKVPTGSNIAVLPGDIPLARDAEIAALIAPVSQNDQTIRLIAARDHQGTNGLFLSANDLIRPTYGPNSFANFQSAAIDAGIDPEILDAEYLSHDVDTAEDLNDLASIAVEGFTYEFLNKIGYIESNSFLKTEVS